MSLMGDVIHQVNHPRNMHIHLPFASIKLHWVGMVAQLLLEETDHAQSLLVSTIVKHA